MKNAGAMINNSWNLFDSWGLESKYEEPIPFGDLVAERWYVWYDPNECDTSSVEKIGLDYALFPVPPLIGSNLDKNRIEPFIETTIASLDDDFDAYFMLGFPSLFLSIEPLNKDSHVIDRELVKINIERITESAYPGIRCTLPCFYGKITESEEYTKGKLSDIKGMSGGPIIGLKGNRYFLVALQSSIRNKTNIRGVGMKVFLEYLENDFLPNNARMPD